MLFEYVSIHNLKHAGLHNGIPIDNLPVQAFIIGRMNYGHDMG